MELVTLDDNFQPQDTVENYASLIWTERYDKSGDFQIQSNDVNYLINKLKLDVEGAHSYVSLRESSVPMVVEVHKIEKKKGAGPLLTVTGRAFESVLERRASVKELATGTVRTPWMVPATKESDAAFVAMRTVIGDLQKSQDGIQVLPSLSPAVSPNDAIPEISLILSADYRTPSWTSTATYSAGDIVLYNVTVYQATSLADNLNKAPGLNPTYWTAVSTITTLWSASTAYIFGDVVRDTAGAVYIATGLSGNLNKTPATNPSYWDRFNKAQNQYEIAPKDLYNAILDLITANHHGLKSVRPLPGSNKVGIEIYNGADLTNEVVFDAKFDQIDNATYLLSEQGSANVAYVYGSNGAQSVLKTAAPEPAGLDRRVLVLDQSSDSTVNTSDVRRTRGLIELYNNNATGLFDGEVAEQIAVGYNSQYFLGDILRLDGEYGLSENVRVVEFIRTSDATGDKAYPTFEVVS